MQYHKATAISVTLTSWTWGTATFTPATGTSYTLNSLPIGTQIQLVQIEWVNTYIFLHNGSEIWSLTITPSSWYNFDSVRVSGTIVTSTAVTLNNWNAIEVFFVIDSITIKLNYNPSIAPHLHWENGWWSGISILNIWWNYFFLGWDWEELQLWVPNTLDTMSVFCRFDRWYWLSELSYTTNQGTISITTSTQPFSLENNWEFNATEKESPMELRTYVVDDNGNNMLGIWWDWIGWGLEPQTDYYSTTLPLTSEYFQVTSAYSASSWELTMTIDGDRLLRLVVDTSDWYNFVSLEYWAFDDWYGFNRFQTINPTDDWVRYNTYQTYTTMGRYPLALRLIVNKPRFTLYAEPSDFPTTILNNASQAALSAVWASNVTPMSPNSFKYIISDNDVSWYQYWLIFVVFDSDYSNVMAYAFEIRDGGTVIYDIIRQPSLDWWSATSYCDNIFNKWDTSWISYLWISWVTDLESLWQYLFNLFHP